MNPMKTRFFALALVLIMTLALAACTNDNGNNSGGNNGAATPPNSQGGSGTTPQPSSTPTQSQAGTNDPSQNGGDNTSIPPVNDNSGSDNGNADSAEDFEYSYYGSNGIRIKGYTGSKKDVVIPATIENRPVQYIGIDAFRNLDKLESITLPDSINSIHEQAFDGCTSLRDIIIPESVEHININDNAFNNCPSLSEESKQRISQVSDYTFEAPRAEGPAGN